MTAPGELITTRQYLRSFERLSPQEQREVDLAVMKFWRQPDLPGLRLHQLNARERRFHSISPNMDLRIILLLDGPRRVLMYVGRHDEAYRWAETRRVERHEITGTAQIVEYLETVRELPVAVPAEAPVSPLFAAETDDYLLSLGVPRDWLPRLREVTDEAGLLRLVDHLPEEAAEALLELAEGGRPAPPAPVAQEEDPYTSGDAVRRFHVLGDEIELARALERPWPEWTVFLHPTQRAVVEANFDGAARVTGSAGTGKSVVAMHRAARLAREGREVLLTTFSRVLAQRLSAGMDILLEGEPEARSRVTVQHLHGLAVERLRTEGFRVRIADEAEVQHLLVAHRGDLDRARWSDPFLAAEWNAVIDYWGVRTRESYLSADRTGRGNRLPASAREAIWPVFEAVQTALRMSHRLTWGDACEQAADLLLQRGAPFDHVIVDEAQDFAPRELALCLQLSRCGTAGLFFAGDPGQRIYKYPFPWSRVGLDIRGRSRRLTINYRTSAQLRRFADRLLPDRMEGIGGGEESRRTHSLFTGPEPEIRSCADAGQEASALAEWLSSRLAEGMQAAEIAVLSRTARRAKGLAARAATPLGLKWQEISGMAADAVFAGTLHGVKGLEFRAVAIVGCEDGHLPLQAALDAEIEDEARAQAEERERHLLYVACTRARDALLILHREPITRFLRDQSVL